MTRRSFCAALVGVCGLGAAKVSGTPSEDLLLVTRGKEVSYQTIEEIHEHATRELYDRLCAIERRAGITEPLFFTPETAKTLAESYVEYDDVDELAAHIEAVLHLAEGGRS